MLLAPYRLTPRQPKRTHLKILLYGINFAPELTGIGKYTGELATWLAASGHEVRVVTAPPYYPDWSIHAGYSALRYSRETLSGVTVFRTPLWVPNKPTGLRRILHLVSFAITSFPVVLMHLRWRPDVVWLVEPPLVCAPAALLLARLCQATSWLHIQDYEVDAAFELGLLKGQRIYKAVSAVERWVMRRFDRVSTISERMVERARSKNVDQTRLSMVPNWADISTIKPLQAASPYRVELGIIPPVVVALYSGNMGGKQGLEILSEAAALLQENRSIQFVFCGTGSGRADLERRCGSLPNVQFLDLQPVERLGELLGLADIHLLPQRADAADLVMPSKLTGMLSSGRPVVATAHAHTELGRIVTQCGRLAPPENASALALVIQQLAENPILRADLGDRARAYAEQHIGRDAVLRKFEQDLEAAAGDRT